MKKTIRDFDLKDKKVIIRVDFNVPIQNNVIVDDTRIKESLETIKYAIDNGAKVILMSHLGRVKDKYDKASLSLRIVATRLSELLEQQVIFVPYTNGLKLRRAVKKLKSGDVLLMENTRFEDIKGNKESSNDAKLGKSWASLGDIFINDAFGTSHRAHASNVGIATNLESGIGFLIERELKTFEPVLTNPKHPFTVILGGAKVADKIPVIKNLVNVADHILIGGGMAYTFLYATGHNVGKSLLDLEHVELCKELLKEYKDKIILPVDSVNSKEIDDNIVPDVRNIDEFFDSEMGLDIGPDTIEQFKYYLEKSKTIVWNGPLGYSELNTFAIGTKSICEILKNVDATKIIGGGDTGAIIEKLGFKDAVTYISTGGGASLELLSGKKLPGIEIINEKDKD